MNCLILRLLLSQITYLHSSSFIRAKKASQCEAFCFLQFLKLQKDRDNLFELIYYGEICAKRQFVPP
jgi:hypothetical protein